MGKYRKMFLVLIYVGILGFIGGTLAGWVLEFDDELTNISFLVQDEQDRFKCSADGGEPIIPSDVVIMPSACDSAGNVIMREITTDVEIDTSKSNVDVLLEMWLTVNEIGLPLSESENFRYVVTTTPNSCTSDIVGEGTFNGKKAGDTVPLFNKNYLLSVEDKYYLYIWLDEAEENPETANQIFNLSLGGTCSGTYKPKVTFDLNGGIISEFYSTPGEYIYIVPYDGEYKFELWGAQGGSATYSSTTYSGGRGGYSTGTYSAKQNEMLYVNVGGMGISYTTNSSSSSSNKNGSGYNGGGGGSYAVSNSSNGGGGGASHIASVSGLLSTLEDNKDSILIVAGGGGGGASHKSAPSYSGTGGSGGGYKGVNSISASSYVYCSASGGSQSSGGVQSNVEHTSCNNRASFGLGSGGSGSSGGSLSGGGGGYYGGARGMHGPAAGGSGYIGNSLLTDKAMYCYNCTTSNDVDTLTYSTTKVSSNAIANYAKNGNGAVKITLSSYATDMVIYGNKYDNLFTPTREGYKFIGWNMEPDGSGITVTSDTTVDISTDHTLYAIWEPTILYLYDAGDENIDITGGWSYKKNSSGTISKNSNNISISLSGVFAENTYGIVYTTKKIDLTNYSKLVINSDWIVSQSSSGAYTRFAIYSSIPSSYETVRDNTVEYILSGNTIDVSNLSGSYYIVVAASFNGVESYSIKQKITSIYLE